MTADRPVAASFACGRWWAHYPARGPVQPLTAPADLERLPLAVRVARMPEGWQPPEGLPLVRWVEGEGWVEDDR